MDYINKIFIKSASFLKSLNSNTHFKKQKFVIILGAGRCGTTYVVNELNKLPGVNIYGENDNLFSKMIQSLNSIEKTISYAQQCHKASEKRQDKNSYLGVEWYNDVLKLKKIAHSLESSMRMYFNQNQNICGFKEIRFFTKEDVSCLIYFEKKYDVYYIHMTRDLEEQSKSAFWTESKDAKQNILNINKNITDSLEGKKNYLCVDLSEVTKDISIIKKFIGLKYDK